MRFQILTLAQNAGAITSHHSRPKGTENFAGIEHTLELEFHGSEACSIGEGLIETLPVHEFSVSGGFIAHAGVVEQKHTFNGASQRLELIIKLWFVKED